MLFEDLQPFAISLIVGLAAGVERERSTKDGNATSGVRTLALVALSGTLAARVASVPLTAALGLLVVALATSSYWRSTAGQRQDGKAPDIGLTTEIATGLVFGLGYLSLSAPLLAGVLGVVMITVLNSRDQLHEFAHRVLLPSEINAVLTLAVTAFVIVPFLPDRTLDVWGLVNPRRLVEILVLIAAIEFGGYVAERVAGPRAGMLIAGFFGGFASSTAVFLHLSKQLRERPENFAITVGAALFATSATILFFVAIITAASLDLIVPVGIPATAAAATALGLGWMFGGRARQLAVEPARPRRHPLDVRGVVKLGLAIGALLTVSAIVRRNFGPDALGLLSFAGGLFELHSVALANATLHAAGSISGAAATKVLLFALGGSFVSKIVICWTFAFGRFAMVMTAMLLAVASAAALVFVLLR